MKCAVYARVSDDKLKGDGQRRQDIKRQVQKLTAFCHRMGYGDPIVYQDDGKSAYKEDYQSRPAFVKLLRAIRGRHVQRVVVEDLTRWSRRIEDGLKTLRATSSAGCTVTSMSEGECDITESQGWFKCGVALLFAEWSSRSMSDKVKSGMRRRLTKKENICKSCGIVHLGRHPKVCRCENCLKRLKKKGRS